MRAGTWPRHLTAMLAEALIGGLDYVSNSDTQQQLPYRAYTFSKVRAATELRNDKETPNVKDE